ncbi:hypothetical protein KA036_00915 [Candidatus Gracilibacteria bacterium]|nr:hypothetical protein [Candidatus Gracilibacteria bacterium]
MTTYNIDRNTASRLLNVSIRTVDRYIDNGKLSSVKSDGRIWLSKEEILNILNPTKSTKSTTRHDNTRPVDKVDIKVENRDDMSTRQEDTNRNNEENTYRKPEKTTMVFEQIFNELKEEISIKDKRLAQASYRIGQLEAQISELVPKLELENQQIKLLETTKIYEEQLQEKELLISQKETEKAQLDAIRIEELGQKDQVIARLDEELHLEKVNKWIYAAILYILVLGFIAIWIVLKWL